MRSRRLPLLPFAPASFDLVISNLALHWVNDLPGALIQLRRALRPDGLLVAAMFGGETLTELRQALLQAELTEEGGASPRVSPHADVRDAGALLQRAGFALPVVDRATIANIVRHRAEEIFEMVRDRLADSPFAAEPKARVVLSGGASQLTGSVELATRILNRPVRIGRPLGFGRLPNEAKSASFAVPAGLLVYPQYAHLEHVEPRHTRQLRTGTNGYFGKVGRWLREGF